MEADTSSDFGSGLKKTWTVESGSLNGTSINGTLTWSRTLSGLEFGKNYKLRVRVENTSDISSGWSGIVNITTVSAPNILFPADNSSNVHPQFTLHIGRIEGISRMVVEADTSSDFGSGLKKTWTVESGSLNGTSINGTLTWSRTLNGLEFGKNYKLRARVENTSDISSGWSGSATISTIVSPQLVSPNDNAVNVSTNTNFDWNSISGSTAYTLQVSESNLFDSLIINETYTNGTAFSNTSITKALTADKNYFWRIRASHASDTSSWAERRFSTGASLIALPETPQLVAPATNASIHVSTVALEWEEVSGASYIIELSTDTTFNTIFKTVESNLTSEEINEIELGNTYHWRVRSIKDGLASTWSDSRSFKADYALSWPSPNPIFYGTGLPASVLNASVQFDQVEIEGTYEYSVNEGDILDAGTVIITVTFTPQAQGLAKGFLENEIVVNKKPLHISSNSASKTYGDVLPELIGSIEGGLQSDSLTLVIETSVIDTTPVGEYDITPTLSDPNQRAGNYDITISVGKLTVTKRALTATAFDKEKTYGESNPTFEGLLEGDISVDELGLAFDTEALISSSVGDYDIVPQVIDPQSRLANYELSQNNGLLRINKRDLSITAENKSKVYGESNPTFTAVIEGQRSEDDLLVNFSTDATSDSDVGEYEIVATLDQTNGLYQNYATSVVNGTLSITQATPSIVLEDIIKHVNDEDFVLYATSNSDGEITYQVLSGDQVIAINGNTVSILAAGNAQIKAVQESTLNYTSAEKTISITVNSKFTATISGIENINKTYDDEAFILEASTNSDEAVQYEIISGNSIFLTNAGEVSILSVGETIVRAFVPESDSYFAAEKSISINVAPAVLTIELSNLSQVYDGTQKEVGVRVNPSGISFSITYDGANAKPINAGSYSLMIQSADPNYAGEATATFTIEKAHPTISFENMTYNINEASVDGSIPFDGAASDSDGAMNYTQLSGETVMFLLIDDFLQISELMVFGTGQAEIMVSQSATNNYHTAEKTAIFTITEKQVGTISNLNNVSRGFAEGDFNLTATTNSSSAITYQKIDGSSVSITSNGQVTVNSVGESTIKASIAETATHTAFEKTITVSIVPSPVTIQISNLKQVYDGNEKTVNVTTSPANIATTITYNGIENAPINAGEYSVMVSVDDPNYTGASTATLEIAKAISEINWDDFEIEIDDIIEGIFSLGGATTNSTAAVSYQQISGLPNIILLNEAENLLSFSALDLGIAEIRASVEETGNFLAAQKLISVSVIETVLGLGEPMEKSNIKVFPNPVNGNFFKVLAPEAASLNSIKVWDVSGKEAMVTLEKVTKNQWIINTDLLEKGLYIVEVNTSVGTIDWIKIILN
ncbi:MBG domain-containing protein [Cytophagales bacterium LB-30]|uniref:MBG domain-containing protein n=1 Tax=Shiella aurantiaca TaxID=3058365 RepID=A0ABT8F8V1_9BACT|nr:MBG domain-containing protein [Shiella aurantiaca]